MTTRGGRPVSAGSRRRGGRVAPGWSCWFRGRIWRRYGRCASGCGTRWHTPQPNSARPWRRRSVPDDRVDPRRTALFMARIDPARGPGWRAGMPISLHKQATTTPKIRAAIQASTEPARKVAERYGISEQTVWKWRKRDSVHALSRAGKAEAPTEHPQRDWPCGPMRHGTRQLSGERARHGARRPATGLVLRRHAAGFCSAVDTGCRHRTSRPPPASCRRGPDRRGPVIDYAATRTSFPNMSAPTLRSHRPRHQSDAVDHPRTEPPILRNGRVAAVVEIFGRRNLRVT